MAEIENPPLVASTKSYLKFVDFHKLGYWDYYTNLKKKSHGSRPVK